MKYRQALTEAGLYLLPSLDLLLDGMWVQRLLTLCVGVRSGKSRCLFREEETLLVTTCVPILQKGEGGRYLCDHLSKNCQGEGFLLYSSRLGQHHKMPDTRSLAQKGSVFK